MAREKKPVHKVQMTEGKRNIIQMLLQEYDIESAQDIQDALKDLLGGTIKEMMEAEMDEHLGTPNQNALTAMTIVMAISLRGSTAATAAWRSRCRKTASLPLNLKLLKSVRRTFLISIRRLSPCMQKG